MNIEQTVTKVVCDMLGAFEEECTPNASLMRDLGADELDIVEIVMELEKQLDISIPYADCEGIETISDLIKICTDLHPN